MIHHIFKIIWNERKTNLWIVCEFVLVFTVMWFCVDFLFFMGSRYTENPGYDMNHVYLVSMGEKPKTQNIEYTPDELYAQTSLFIDRVKHYPGVEAVALSQGALPYGGMNWYTSYTILPDTVSTQIHLRWATPDYFKVFDIKLESGKMFDWGSEATENDVILSPNRWGMVGKDTSRKPSEATLLVFKADEKPKQVVGTIGRLKSTYFQDFEISTISPLPRKDFNLSNSNEITIRVNPDADTNFAERFEKDMREQLNIGQYYFISLASLEHLRKQSSQLWGVDGQINGTNTITLFLFVNIFLGILGTFWLRTQMRRSQIGLRIALGASKRNVKRMMLAEAMLLLSISAIIGTIICTNIGNTDLLDTIGIPTGSSWKSEEGFSLADHATNLVITFGFLAIVSIIAVWYPAKQAADTQPAEALHAE